MSTVSRTSSARLDGARSGPRRLVAAVAGTTLLAGLLAAPPAYADRAEDAPVTADDRVSMREGAGRLVDVLDNDSDPNGHPLTVCRVETTGSESIQVDADRGGVVVYAFEPGVYEISYWACDYDYLTAATLTVTVTEAPPVAQVRARKVPGKPGRVRFFNPGELRVVVFYGSRRGGIDGTVRVAPRSVEAISATRKRLSWGAITRDGRDAGFGTLRGLKAIAEPSADHGYYLESEVIVSGRWPGSG